MGGDQTDSGLSLALVEFLTYDEPTVVGPSFASQHLSPPISGQP